jgi:hypothetical protein
MKRKAVYKDSFFFAGFSIPSESDSGMIELQYMISHRIVYQPAEAFFLIIENLTIQKLFGQRLCQFERDFNRKVIDDMLAFDDRHQQERQTIADQRLEIIDGYIARSFNGKLSRSRKSASSLPVPPSTIKSPVNFRKSIYSSFPISLRLRYRASTNNGCENKRNDNSLDGWMYDL